MILATTGSEPSLRPLAVRLSVLMLLEFIVFGSWFATLGLVLATHHLDHIIGQAYLLSAIAAILSPLLSGALGDRYLAPRTVLCLSHLLGAALMVMVPGAVTSGNAPLTLVLVFAYMLAFQPTLGLVNSIALSALGDRQSIFPYVRVFAPVGWFLAGLAMGAMGLSASTGVFYAAAVVSLLLAGFAMTLPDTRASTTRSRMTLGDMVGSHALSLFRERSFAVLMACALMTSVSLGIYNSFASPYLAALGIGNVAGTLALGQFSEVAFIATIPWVLPRIGMKWALLVGMLTWGVRFLLFIAAAHGHANAAVAGVLLHGICNDYFLVIAAMYVARIAGPALASQAQSWLILVISGFGQAIGSGVAGHIYGNVIAPRQALGPLAWSALWMVPVALAALTAFTWLSLFKPVPHVR